MKKKLLSAALVLAMALSMVPGAFAAEAVTASPTNDKLTVDGVERNPTVYKIGDSNYFKIRDLAAVLNGTSKQFSVGYDGEKQSVTATPGQPYELTGTELTGAASSSQPAQASGDAVYVNGQRVEAEVYKIDGSNYFKLRDLGAALGFEVNWTAERGVIVETGGAAQTTDPTQPGTSYTYDELANCYIDALLCWNNGGQCMKMILTEAMNAEEARAENRQGEAVQKMRSHVNEMLSYAEELLAIVNQYPDIFAETISDEESVIAGLKTLQSMDFTSRDDIYFVLALSDQWIKVSKDLNALEDLILSYN